MQDYTIQRNQETEFLKRKLKNANLSSQEIDKQHTQFQNKVCIIEYINQSKTMEYIEFQNRWKKSLIYHLTPHFNVKDKKFEKNNLY